MDLYPPLFFNLNCQYRDMAIIKEFSNQVEIKLKTLLEKELPALGLQLYDVQFRPSTGELTAFIFDPKTGTALIEDCIKVDHALTPYFESESWPSDKITLEVSSPGIYRHLNSVEHFKNATGEKILVLLNTPLLESQIVEKKENAVVKGLKGNSKFSGILKSCDKNGVVIEINDVKIHLPYECIKKANVD